MECHMRLTACLLLLWTLTASVSCDDASKKKGDFIVTPIPEGIVLVCADDTFKIRSKELGNVSMPLVYQDDKSGEYACYNEDTKEEKSLIFVKFRTCDNCIHLDNDSLVGIIVGDVVATVVIGVAVYLIASQTKTAPTTSYNKSSDRQHLVPKELGNRNLNTDYQPLKPKGQRDVYDFPNRR